MANRNFFKGILVIILVFGMTVVGCGDDSTNSDTYNMMSYLIRANDERGGLDILYGNDGSIITHDSDNLYFVAGTKEELQTIFQAVFDTTNCWDSSPHRNGLTLSEIEHYLKTGEHYPPGQADDTYKNYFIDTFSPHSSTILDKLNSNGIVLVTSIIHSLRYY